MACSYKFVNDNKNIIRALKEYGYKGWWQIDVWKYPEPFLASEISRREIKRVLNQIY